MDRVEYLVPISAICRALQLQHVRTHVRIHVCTYRAWLAYMEYSIVWKYYEFFLQRFNPQEEKMNPQEEKVNSQKEKLNLQEEKPAGVKMNLQEKLDQD